METSLAQRIINTQVRVSACLHSMVFACLHSNAKASAPRASSSIYLWSCSRHSLPWTCRTTMWRLCPGTLGRRLE